MFSNCIDDSFSTLFYVSFFYDDKPLNGEEGLLSVPKLNNDEVFLSETSFEMMY